MSQGPAGNRPSTSTPHEKTHKTTILPQSRTLPPIQQAILPGPTHDVFSRAPAIQNVQSRPTPPPSSTPPDQRVSRPIGVQNLLNPTAGDIKASQSYRRNAEIADLSPRTASVGTMSHPATPSLSTTSVNKRSPADVSLPSITPPLMSAYPHLPGRAMTPRSPTTGARNPMTSGFPSATIDAKKSPFVLPRNHPNSSGGPATFGPTDLGTAMVPKSYVSATPQNHSPPLRQGSRDSASHPCMPNLLERVAIPGTVPPTSDSQSTSPSSVYSYPQNPTPPVSMPTIVPTGQPQSFFSGPLTSSGPASTVAPVAFDQKVFDAPASGPVGQGQYQLMTLETEHGPIQVPVDVQAASKVADEKRKRNATASHRFRQRRKEKEQETSENIAKLEAQIREMTEEKDFYQRERDYFQDITLRNRVPVTARPPSPRRRRHASLAGPALSPFDEPEGATRSGRNTRRRTSAYIPPSGPAPQAEAAPSIPSFEHVGPLQLDNTRGGVGMHPFPPSTNPFDRPTPH